MRDDARHADACFYEGWKHADSQLTETIIRLLTVEFGREFKRIIIRKHYKIDTNWMMVHKIIPNCALFELKLTINPFIMCTA